MEECRKKQLEWLIELAKIDGWKPYAWSRAKELDADQSGLFKGIAEELKQSMKRLKEAQQKSGD